jgi:hypothetical protein
MLMVGHCAGVRNHQEIGDFVLASGYMRGDRLLDDALPPSVPIIPSFLLNRYLAKVLEESDLRYRVGIVHTTIDRNWELALRRTLGGLQASRSVAVDMESATVAANGFRYRIPTATLLCVSDKPLHGKPKLPEEAKTFYSETKKQHIAVAVAAIELARQDFPGGLPNSDIRALDDPLKLAGRLRLDAERTDGNPDQERPHRVQVKRNTRSGLRTVASAVECVRMAPDPSLTLFRGGEASHVAPDRTGPPYRRRRRRSFPTWAVPRSPISHFGLAPVPAAGTRETVEPLLAHLRSLFPPPADATMEAIRGRAQTGGLMSEEKG